eukprot:3800887-Ditylum_brightwellii.AAC.2
MDTSLPSTISEPNPSSPPPPLEDTPTIISPPPIEIPEQEDEPMNEHGYLIAQIDPFNSISFSKPISEVFYEKLDTLATAPTQATPGSAG